MQFRIAEALRQHRCITKLRVPLCRQHAQGRAQRFAGEIGTARALEHEEAAGLHDEFEAPRTGHAVPANPRIAVLETKGGGAPDDDGHQDFSLRPLFVNQLPERVPRGASGTQKVLLIKVRRGLPSLFGRVRRADRERSHKFDGRDGR